MLQRLTLVLIVAIAAPQSAWARRACEGDLTFAPPISLSSTEIKLASILHQMNVLKTQATTLDVLQRLESLNGQALALIGDELKRLNVAFRIVDPRLDPGNPMSRPARKKVYQSTIEKLEEAKQTVQKNLQDGNSPTDQQRSIRLLEVLNGQINSAKARLAEVDEPAKLNPNFSYAPMAESRALGAFHMLMKPYIVIDVANSNPPLINKIIRQYEVELILSPNFKSLSPDALAGVSAGEHARFYYPIEEIFGASFGLNGTLLHEITHLRHAKMETQGAALPYYIDLKANKGEKLHFEQGGFYDEHMSFDELAAWNKDLNYASSVALGSLRKRNFKDGDIYQQGNSNAVRYRIANGLAILCRSGAQALAALKAQLAQDPASARFLIRSRNAEDPSHVIIPYVRDGKEIGSIEVTLVNLNADNQNKRFEILQSYIDSVEARLKLHSENAKIILAAFGGLAPDQPWKKISE